MPNMKIDKPTVEEVIAIWRWLGVQRHLRTSEIIAYREWKLEVATLERWYTM